MSFGHLLVTLPLLFILMFLTLVPILIGFLWMLPDATRRGQPGWLWALLTIPLSWLAVLAYVLVRSMQAPRPAA